jgi:hypothetical protein
MEANVGFLFVCFASDNLLRRAACQEAQVMLFSLIKFNLSYLHEQEACSTPEICKGSCISAIWLFFPTIRG